MARLYDGPYAELLGQEGHEGFAARLLADGARSRPWGSDVVAYVACCSCGWSGKVRWPGGDEGRDEALAEWDEHHLRPLIRAAAAQWPAWAGRVASRAQAVVGYLEEGRPDRAGLVMARLVEDVQFGARVTDQLVVEKSRADARLAGEEVA